MSEIRKVAVVGAGVMGAAIAAHVANAGVPVVLLDIVPEGELMNLERAAFLELAHNPASIARVKHMLKTEKPLRN